MGSFFNDKQFGKKVMQLQTAAGETDIEMPPRDQWRGVLWMNNPKSPWRKDSEEAEKLLGKAGFVVVSIETSGISGPVYVLSGKRYKGLTEIKTLVSRAKSVVRKKE